jgi:hypothetical protein
LEADSTVDAAKADVSWERSSDPARQKPSAEKLRPVAEAAVGSVRETLKEQGLPASGKRHLRYRHAPRMSSPIGPQG